MAKKAAAGRSRARKGARKAAGKPKVGVDFKRLHDEMDAALDRLRGYKQSAKRDALIVKLAIMRNFKLCPTHGMFAELK